MGLVKDIKEQVMTFTGIGEVEYNTLFFDLGCEWIDLKSKGALVWDIYFEGWWGQEWCKASKSFLEAIHYDVDKGFGLTILHHNKPYRVHDRGAIKSWYVQGMKRAMLECPANAAVMELSLHNTIKNLNK